MSCLGNLIWFCLGGIILGGSWLFAGVFWCITIIGIPVGLQCFKLAGLAFFPFGQEVTYGGGVVYGLLNIIWLFSTGLPIALIALLIGLLFTVTIIGIPFGIQCFKISKLALFPFGASIV